MLAERRSVAMSPIEGGRRTTRGPVLAAAVLISLLAGVACTESDPGTICTLIGCSDAVTVSLDPPIASPYRVRAAFPAGQEVAFLCTGAGVSEQVGAGVAIVTCDPGRFTITCAQANSFCSASPVTVEVRRADAALRTGRLTPAYQTVQPNGPRCDPTCTVGTATLR
jgi:hypothetical protein